MPTGKPTQAGFSYLFVPFTRGEFEIIRAPDTQGILGVYSRSTARPFKRTGFLPEQQLFSKAGSYSEWRFEFIVPVVQPVQVKEPNKTDVKAPKP